MINKSDRVDKIDRAIINELQKQGRLPLLNLASRIGVSHGTVRTRLNRLLRDKVMTIVGIVDPWKVGYPTLVVMGIRADLRRMPAIEHALLQFDELTTVAVTAGRYDFIIWGHFTDDSHLLKFLSGKLSKIQGIRATETYHVLSMNKRIWQWNMPIALNGQRSSGRRRKVSVE